MKHIKKHPINDKAQTLSKDMKKQDLVKPKTDKKLDADDSLSDPKLSKKYVKPSNKKLDGENFLAIDSKIKSLKENMKHLKNFNEMLDPMGKWDENEKESDIDTGIFSESSEESDIKSLLNSGKRMEVVSISNFNSDDEVISFDLLVKGVWLKGEDVEQVKSVLLRKYPQVTVLTGEDIKKKFKKFHQRVLSGLPAGTLHIEITK